MKLVKTKFTVAGVKATVAEGNPLVGPTLTTLGLIAIAAGMAAVIYGLDELLPNLRGSVWQAALRSGLAGAAVAAVYEGCRKWLWWPAARFRAIISAGKNFKDKRPQVLYLRSFGDDAAKPNASETIEESLKAVFREAGPVRAIGRPGETLPPPGAARLGLEDGDWLDSVIRLMRESCLVVLRSGCTPGLIEELEAAVANIDPRRLLISFAPEITAANESGHRTAYEQFRAETGAIFPKPLPPWRPGTLFAAFDADWSPVLLGKPGGWWYYNYRSGPRIMMREAVRERLAAQGISIRRKRADFPLGFYSLLVVTCITSSLMHDNIFPVRWYTLKPAGETFSVELPVNPKTVKRGAESVLYMAEVPDAVYTVAIDPVPAGTGSSLDSIEPLLLGNEPKTERLLRQAVSGGSVGGRQLAWTANGKVVKLRFFVAGGKLYRLGIIGTNEYVDKPSRDTERFFGSFHAGASLVSQAGNRIELGGAVGRVVAEK